MDVKSEYAWDGPEHEADTDVDHEVLRNHQTSAVRSGSPDQRDVAILQLHLEVRPTNTRHGEGLDRSEQIAAGRGDPHLHARATAAPHDGAC
jgi:hypothetical protein